VLPFVVGGGGGETLWKNFEAKRLRRGHRRLEKPPLPREEEDEDK